jgi:hypothetical protein
MPQLKQEMTGSISQNYQKWFMFMKRKRLLCRFKSIEGKVTKYLYPNSLELKSLIFQKLEEMGL